MWGYHRSGAGSIITPSVPADISNPRDKYSRIIVSIDIARSDMAQLNEIKGKLALVTGASGG